MALFSLNKDWIRSGNTAIANAFILDIMPSISNADYIKIYLYCLMYAQANNDDISIESIANILGFDKEYVLKALAFLERRNLIVRIQEKPLKFELIPAYVASIARDDDKNFQAFKDAIFGIFNEKRKIHGGEYQIAYEWIDELGFSVDIIMLFLQHMISTKGINFSFNSANKEIVKLKNAGVSNYDEAEHYFTVQEKYAKGAKAIYNRFRRYSKNPTEDEINLYAKWIKEYEFTHEDIIAACTETTKGEASFAYLDAILKGIVSRNGKGTHGISRLVNNENKQNENVKNVLTLLGIRFNTALVDPVTNLIDSFGKDLVEFCARQVALSGGKINELGIMLESLYNNNIRTINDANEYIKDVKLSDKRLRRVYDTMGINIVPNNRDRQVLTQWCKYFTDDIILKAAEFSKGKKEPMVYMNAILKSWQDRGFDTMDKIKKAQAEHNKSAQANSSYTQGKRLIHQNYTQRQYDESEYNVFMPDLSEEVNDD